MILTIKLRTEWVKAATAKLAERIAALSDYDKRLLEDSDEALQTYVCAALEEIFDGTPTTEVLYVEEA